MEQLRGLRDQHGWDVTAVVSAGQGSLIDMLRKEGIAYHVEPGFVLDGVASTLRMFGVVLRLMRFFRKHRFDVVQSHLLFATLPARFAAWLAVTPVRLTMYPSPYHLDAPITQWMDRFNWWMDSGLIASCQYTRTRLQELGVSPGRIALIYYGADESKYAPDQVIPIDVTAEFGWPASTPVIVKVAYFYPRQPTGAWTPAAVHDKNLKAFEDLIGAMPLIHKTCPDARLLLVGSAWGAAGQAYLEELQAQVRLLQLEQHVVFTGFRHDVNSILKRANVAVQASIYENSGGVIESLIMARPTVATAVGGMIDCVLDGKTGVLVRPSDPADMARGISSLLADPAWAAKLGENGRQWMLENFCLGKCCADLDQLYRRLLVQSQRGAYNPLVSALRCLIGLPLLCSLIFQIAFRDFYLPAHWPTQRLKIKNLLVLPLVADLYFRRRFWPSSLHYPSADQVATIPPSILWANRKITAQYRLQQWMAAYRPEPQANTGDQACRTELRKIAPADVRNPATCMPNLPASDLPPPGYSPQHSIRRASHRVTARLQLHARIYQNQFSCFLTRCIIRVRLLPPIQHIRRKLRDK
ncbi:glycosyltransferase family 4 protein [Pseudomonas sp. N040]|uniref:glycosyltransferase family 4 protein n=1 Tax=Pseudomonas sp. N040 TaxID=2785325 RepID=UPI001E2E540A|nr:glycosyltransferase family 4 protein [Pseudomonas sp. N040]